MCFYRTTLYSCNHSEYAKKIVDCKKQQDFLAGKRHVSCTLRQTHSLHRVRVAAKCAKCQKLDHLKKRVQKALKAIRDGREKRENPGKSDGRSLKVCLSDFLSSESPSPVLTSSETAPSELESTTSWEPTPLEKVPEDTVTKNEKDTGRSKGL